jgi:hypothetical protein
MVNDGGFETNGAKGFVVTDYTIPEMIAHGMGDLQTVSALALPELKWIWLVKAF